jgi:Family of unknown function (DUF6812)
MDEFSTVAAGPITHSVELYTARLFIQGSISGPFKRTSDLINRRDRNYFNVSEASITPLGQVPSASNKMLSPVIVGRDHVHLAATPPHVTEARPTRQLGGTGTLAGREYFVQKQPHACYALTDTFIVYGHCHLLPGTTLENLLNTPDPFIPFTKATIYMLSRPQNPWQRELVVVNKEKMEAFYLAEK